MYVPVRKDRWETWDELDDAIANNTLAEIERDCKEYRQRFFDAVGRARDEAIIPYWNALRRRAGAKHQQ